MTLRVSARRPGTPQDPGDKGFRAAFSANTTDFATPGWILGWVRLVGLMRAASAASERGAARETRHGYWGVVLETRALELGAGEAEFQPQGNVRVLLDPAGHPFCLYL